MRKNDTIDSTPDIESQFYRKSFGQGSKLAYLSHALVKTAMARWLRRS